MAGSQVERIDLSDQDVAYLVGKNGATRIRLENFSGTRLNIDKDIAEIEGTQHQRDLAKLAISITLQQRDGGAVAVNFDSLESREDVSTFDVPRETVGFLLGAKGSTLRQMETNHRVFMFFDNDRLRKGKHGPCKRLYVIGGIEERNNALDEAEDVVRFKLTGQSSRPGRHAPDRRPPPPDHRGGAGPAAPPPASWHDERPPPARYRPYDDRPPPPRGYDDRLPPSREDVERPLYRPPAPAPPREYEDRGGSSAARYDERPPPPRYDDRGPPPPRYEDWRHEDRGRFEDRRDPYFDRAPPPRRDEYFERAPPPPRGYDDRYDRAPPPPRDEYRERDYYGDRGAPPPPRYDDRGAPPPRYDQRPLPPYQPDDRHRP